MIRAARSLAFGTWVVLGAPALIVALMGSTLATALPFGVVLGTRLQAALAHQQPVALGSGEIDPEWWMEFRAHARGLEATFTPTVIGFAAPLDNLSALLDGTPRPLALAGPVVVAALVWAFLWGGVLDRFTRMRPVSMREFVAAGLRHAPRFVVLSLIAALVYAVLYLTVHAWLFGPVYEWLASRAASERDAFFWRVGLYAVFGALLLAVSLVVDYARVSIVSAGTSGVWGAVSAGARFVRANAAAAATLSVLAGVLFAALLSAYGVAEMLGGTRLGGWRGVLVGQAYIVARLSLRLVLAASEVRLFTDLSDRR